MNSCNSIGQNQNNLSENDENLESIIDELNETIYNGELTEIIEVTYAYEKIPDGTYWNTTLFSEFGEIPLSNNIHEEDKLNLSFNQKLKKRKDKKNKNNIVKDITKNGSFRFNKNKYLKLNKNKISNKLKLKIEIINSYIDKIRLLEKGDESEEIKKELLLGSLDYVKNTVEMALYGLPFELEKAGLYHNLNEHEIESRVKIIQSLEKNNFGGMIKDNPEEIAMCYDYLFKKYKKNKDNLTENKQKEYETYLEDITDLIPEHKYIEKKKTENNLKTEKNKEKIDNKLKGNIGREEYIRIFHLVFDILGLDIDIKQDNRSSIYDGESILYIPLNEKYDFLSRKRIMELIVHEIESHYNNLFTNFDLIGNFRSAGNVEKEEGIAMVFERLLNGNNIDEIGIPQHFPKVLMSELLNGTNLKRFLNLNNILEPDKGNNGRFYRLKRNYPIDYKGGQHKDASYGRGVLKVIDYIKDENFDLRKLFLGKIGFDDIPKVERLLELKYLDKEDYLDKIYLPLFIGELIMYILEEKTINKDTSINFDNFMNRVQTKYDFIDFSKLNIPKITFTTKRKVYYIMELLKTKK